jgi:hypothetical protein
MRDTLLSARDFLTERGIPIPGGPPRHSRHYAPAPAVVADELRTLWEQMHQLGATVTVVDREPEPGTCEQCQYVGRFRDIEIYDGDEHYRLCRACAPTAVSTSLEVGAVRVEVCVS